MTESAAAYGRVLTHYEREGRLPTMKDDGASANADRAFRPKPSAKWASVPCAACCGTVVAK